jgi:drug/metabolite transporter (DMT)-like permease
MTAPRGRVIAAFAAIYLVWGSTYLFMRFGVETIPPFWLSGVRYFTAGVLLWLLALPSIRTASRRVAWRGHAIVGTLLTLGNASVAVAVQRIPSGVASLLVAMTPCWMVLLEWRRHRGHPPGRGVVAGLVLGIAGMLVLIGPGRLGGQRIDLVGAGVVLAGTLAWSTGSIYSRTLERHESPLHTSAVQMLWGGAAVTLISFVLGEFGRVNLADVSTRSWLSMVYLVLVGSVIGYSAYMYLLGVTSAARVSTYAFVNPVVAVAIGAAFANEPLTPRVMLAGAVIVVAVALITRHGGERRPASTTPVRQATPVRECP